MSVNKTMAYFPNLGMTVDRYHDLMNDTKAKLTPEEVESGWFFSDEFDGLLIHKTWPEAEFD